MKSVTKKRKNVIRAVDLFCGVGGLTHGLALGGVDVVAGIDLDNACKFPYEKNNDATFLRKDIAHVTATEIRKLLGKGTYTMLAGCAPCQPFSTYSQSARKKKVDPDWSLVSAFGKLAKQVRPHFITMENVPALAAHPVFKRFLAQLDGYHVSWKVVDCEEIGIPQTRRRLVLVASRLNKIELDELSGTNKRTVREAISHLPRLSAGQKDAKDPLHMASRLSKKNLERIRASRPGGTWRDWPAALRAPCHKKATGKSYPSVYGRMEWDKPAPTMTTQCFGFGNGRFGHPEQDRGISLREAAIIQSFPSDYAFLADGETASVSSLGRLIGNAVPVRLGEVIGQSFKRHLRSL